VVCHAHCSDIVLTFQKKKTASPPLVATVQAEQQLISIEDPGTTPLVACTRVERRTIPRTCPAYSLVAKSVALTGAWVVSR
jgi:hypothetical protein